MGTNEPTIQNLNADETPTCIESLCMSCEKQGLTKLLLTRIPHFREVLLSSFECPHCGMKNSEIQSAGVIQDKAVKIQINVAPKDLNRQVVKTSSASVRIPEIDFEIPAFSQKGEITTIEGILDRASTALKQDQPVRRIVDAVTAEKIENVVNKLESFKCGDKEFTMVIDDISGNSFIENPFLPNNDPASQWSFYTRNEEQDKMLGIAEKEQCVEKEEANEDFDITQEVLEFPTNCSNCQAATTTNMKAVDIPFFKQVILMATSCTTCGARTNEVKPGSGIEDKGCRISLKLTDSTDLSRDVLKSDTCVLKLPEIELELQSGTLGGRFTTLEGLFINIKENLQRHHPFQTGDASTMDNYALKIKNICNQLDEIINGTKLDMTVILDDIAGNSYLQNIYAPDEDPNMTLEFYERTIEQNEELGLSEEMIKEHELMIKTNKT